MNNLRPLGKSIIFGAASMSYHNARDLNVTLYTKILLLLKNQLNQVWLLCDVLVFSVLLVVDYFYCQCVLWLGI